jgi:hypothetical protein
MDFGSFYVMKKEVYEYKKIQDLTVYEFYSFGPNGRIRKEIQFDMMQKVPLVFNLVLAKADSRGDLDVQSITDNKDTGQILSSVTNAIIEFLESRPEALVHIEGVTPSRTRLFQMWITKIFDQYCDRISIEGMHKKRWLPFEKDIRFDAFVLKRK